MLIVIRLLTAGSIAVAAAVLLEWTQPARLSVGGGAAPILAAALLIMLWLTRTRPLQGVRIPPSYLREAFVGAVAALAWVGLMQLYFLVAFNTPAIVDRGREETEQNATLLENAGNYEAAADLLLASLENPHSPECINSFASRTILDLTRASESAAGKRREQLILQAIETAARFQVHDDLPRAMLKRFLDRDALDGMNGKIDSAEARARKAEADRSRLERERNGVERAQAEKEQSQQAAFDELKRRADAIQTARSRLAQSAVAHASSLSGYVIDGNLQAARLTLQRLVRQLGVNDATATDAINKLEAEISARRPQNIPVGVAARIRRVDATVMSGMLLVDLQVSDGAGKLLEGLMSKDFSCTQHGRLLRVAAAPLSDTQTLRVAILIDTSASTDGVPIRATKSALPEFINRFPPDAAIRVASFSDQVTLLSDWTTEKSRAVAASKSIRAGGGTALFQAAHQQIQTLAALSGVRLLVIFSDGANMLPGPSADEIIAVARKDAVAVHFVALKGAGYSDTSAVEKIARETGGRTILVHEAGKLTESFRLLADSLLETGYRLAIIDYDAKASCQVVIGSEGAVTLEVEPLAASPSKQVVRLAPPQ